MAAIIDAAPLMAEPTLPHRTRREIAIDAVISTRERIGPSSNPSNSSWILPVSPARPRGGRAANASAGSDRRNGPPRAGTHRAWARSIGSAAPTVAAPSAGEISRATRPSWATDAATRNSTSSAGRLTAAARLARTSAIRAFSASGESSSMLSGCHDRRILMRGSWVSMAKYGPSAASSASSPDSGAGGRAGLARPVTRGWMQVCRAAPRSPHRGPAGARPSGRRSARSPTTTGAGRRQSTAGN